MRAYRLLAWDHRPELVEVPIPEPRVGEVLVKVGGSGACHSDLHLMDWPAGQVPFDPPFTLGHEIAGWVAHRGRDVRDWSDGDPVAIYAPWGCGLCRSCRAGAENYCIHPGEGRRAAGIGRDGGMAEFVRVPARSLVALEELDPVQAAPLTHTALAPYRAIKRSLGLLVPGSTAVVIGVGGLGSAAVQLLRALSPAQIVAVDAAPAKLIAARELGADHALHSDDDAAAQIRSLTGGQGAELVLDLVGSHVTLALSAAVCRMQGHLSVVGLGEGTLTFSIFTLPYECELTTTYWGSITELMEVLALARSGRLHIEVERFGLDDVEQAYRRLRAGTLRGRAVVCPD